MANDLIVILQTERCGIVAYPDKAVFVSGSDCNDTIKKILSIAPKERIKAVFIHPLDINYISLLSMVNALQASGFDNIRTLPSHDFHDTLLLADSGFSIKNGEAESCSFLINHVAQYHRNESNAVENEGLPVYMAADSPDMPAMPVKLERIDFEPERRLRHCGDCGFETRLRCLYERHRHKKHGRRQHQQQTEASLQEGVETKTKTTTTTRNPKESTGNKPILKRRLCPQCNVSFSNEGQYRCHVVRRHASNRRANRPHCIAMLQERLGKPEFSEVLTAENKDPNEFIGHVAALGPQSMIGDLIAGLTVYKCVECPYSSNIRGRLNNHLKRHTAKESDFEPGTPFFRCSLCSYMVGRLDRFLRHWTLHNVDQLPPCIALPEGMSVEQALASIAAAAAVPPPEKKQRSTEPRMPPAQAATPTAAPGPSSSTTPSAPGRDLKKELVLRCPQCPYRSKHGCDMKAHQKMHCDRGTFHCHYCSYSTMRLNALKTHISLHDGEIAGGDVVSAPTPDQPMVQKLPEKDREAEFLPKEVVLSKLYDDSNVLVIGRRMMRSDGSIFYRCIHCPFEAKYPSLLNPHARYHNRGAKYRCPKCSYSTDRDDVLPRHIDSHQNEPAPEGGWFCSACPYRTDSYGKQWHHVQKHKKVGRYNCEICHYGVGSLQSLNDHMALHGIVKLGSIVKVAPSAPTTIAALAEVVAKRKSPAETSENTTTDISNERSSPADTVDSKASGAATAGNSDKEKSEEGVAFGNDFALDMDWSGAAAASTSTAKAKPLAPLPTVKVITRAKATATTTTRTSTPPATRGRGKGKGRAAAPARPAVTGPFKSNVRLELPPMPDALKPKRRRLNGATPIADEEADKVHVCKHCPFTSMDTKMLKLHTRMHEGERPHPCSMCSFSCFTVDALFTHYNVHAPQLPESMLASMKRKLAARKRNGSLLGREILPANSANVFECQQCNNFRTACQDRFLQHRMEHVQTIQQRLMTQLKRAAVEDSRKGKGVKKKLERKWLRHYCTKCCFRSDTVVALMNHLEYHDSPNNVFKCRFCDYSANSSDVVIYHENTHHLDLPTTNQILNAVANNGVIDPALVSEARQKYSCGRCGFHCHELVDCIKHFEIDHATDPLLSQIIDKLRMGLMPTGITVTFLDADPKGKQTGVVGDQQSPSIAKASR
uniref:C2H2-type domain-containing protein n=1 Tax=Panagrellus redivivus TaxID=6233 RepID=A0A7E4W2C6_PANRE